MTEMRATREALGVYWAASDVVPHDFYDRALAEVEAMEALEAAARACFDKYLPVIEHTARTDAAPSSRDMRYLGDCLARLDALGEQT